MDDLIEQLRDVCSGLSAAEIVEQIEASKYADQIQDIEMVARFLASLGADDSLQDDPMSDEPDQDSDDYDDGND